MHLCTTAVKNIVSDLAVFVTYRQADEINDSP